MKNIRGKIAHRLRKKDDCRHTIWKCCCQRRDSVREIYGLSPPTGTFPFVPHSLWRRLSSNLRLSSFFHPAPRSLVRAARFMGCDAGASAVRSAEISLLLPLAAAFCCFPSATAINRSGVMAAVVVVGIVLNPGHCRNYDLWVFFEPNLGSKLTKGEYISRCRIRNYGITWLCT